MLDEGGLAVGDHFVSQPHFDCLIEVVQASDLDIRINGYFGSYDGFLENLLDSSIKTIHLDLCEGNFDIDKIIQISERKNVYLGVINGRSIWRNDLKETLTLLEEVRKYVEIISQNDPKLKNENGLRLRNLLYLFEKDVAIKTLLAV